MLCDAVDLCVGIAPAIVFDHVGLHENHLDHLEWLAKNIRGIGIVKVCEIAWRFADWE